MVTTNQTEVLNRTTGNEEEEFSSEYSKCGKLGIVNLLKSFFKKNILSLEELT